MVVATFSGAHLQGQRSHGLPSEHHTATIAPLYAARTRALVPDGQTSDDVLTLVSVTWRWTPSCPSLVVQENLRQEAKAVEHLDLLVSQRVLSAVQAAVFVADAYPARADALVLASTCATATGG